MNAIRIRPALLLATLSLSACATPPLLTSQEPRRLSVTTLIESFDAQARGQVPVNRAATVQLTAMLTQRERFGSASVDSLLLGLEGLSRSSDPHVRIAAVTWLSTAGEAVSPTSLEVIQRLTRIYDQVEYDDVPAAVIQVALPRQANRRAAAELLKKIAEEPEAPSDLHPSLAARAVTSLQLLNEQGRAALAELYEAKRVTDSEARELLRRLFESQEQINLVSMQCYRRWIGA